MRSFRLLWISVVVLLLQIPLVLAQGFFGKSFGSWLIFLANTAIIWGALFILSVFILKDRSDKEKTLIWFLLLGVALLISWFAVGFTSFIWKSPIFAKYLQFNFIINTMVVAGVAYALLRFFGIANVEGADAKFGVWGLLLFFSGLFAQGITGYVWDLDNVNKAIEYFMDPVTGVFTEGRLFTFIFLTVIFSWILTSYMNVGKDNNSRLPYIIAISLAATMSHGSSTSKMIVVRLFEVVFFLVLSKQMVGEGSLFKTIAGYAGAIGIVGWLGRQIAPNESWTALYFNAGKTTTTSGGTASPQNIVGTSFEWIKELGVWAVVLLVTAIAAYIAIRLVGNFTSIIFAIAALLGGLLFLFTVVL